MANGSKSHTRTFMSCALVALVMALAPAPAQAQLPSSLQILHEINGVRTTHGLGRVHVAPSLRYSAFRYARHLMRSGYFGHAARIQASSAFHYKGEILEIHRGTTPCVRAAVREWLNSPSHRALILDPRFTYAGAGRATGYFQGRRRMIWVVQFGRP
jgi:uncharacterized protein YkwD